MATADGPVPLLDGDESPRRRWSVLRSELPRTAEIAALVAIAVVQPVLGPFGESPGTFLAAGASGGQVVLFALLVALVPLAVLAGGLALTRWAGPAARSVAQTVVVAGLAGLAVTYITRQLGAGAAVRVVVALLAALLVGLAHRRWEPTRLFLRFASPTLALLVLLFLFASPVAALVRPPTVDIDEAAAEDLPPVVVIVLDELPTASLLDAEGGIDEELVPNFARLADTSTWYRNHTAVAWMTAVSLPAIVSGVLPADGSQPAAVYREHPDTLFSAFAPTHEVRATEWITELCPPGICSAETVAIDDDAAALVEMSLTRRGALGGLLGEAARLWWGQVWPTSEPPEVSFDVAGVETAAEVARPGLEFLSGLGTGEGDRPRFDYLHTPAPHQPWSLLGSGADYNGPFPAPGAEWLAWAGDDAGEQLAEVARTRHLLQVQWADRLLGEIFDRLEDDGTWDDAVVVVTSDHGVSFEPGQPVRADGDDNLVDIYWSPLFIKAPGQDRPEVVDDNVLAVDVAVTVAELAGVELDWEVDGISLVDRRRPGSAKPAWFGGRDEPDARPEGTVGELDVDGLDELLAGPGRPGAGSDPLRIWRHGRHAALLGQQLDDLGVCRSGPGVSYAPPPSWDDFLAGRLDRSEEPLPLWHEAVVDVDEQLDVAAVLDGRVVGWGVARPDPDGARVGLLLAEPLLAGAEGRPVLHQIVDDDGCRLVPLSE